MTLLHVRLGGGSWDFDARHVRCADRYIRDPGDHYGDYGLRPVAEVKEKVVDRGGCYLCLDRHCRPADRTVLAPGNRDTFRGFRPVAGGGE